MPKRSSESMGEMLDLKDCTEIFQNVCGWGRVRQKTGNRIRERKKDWGMEAKLLKAQIIR